MSNVIYNKHGFNGRESKRYGITFTSKDGKGGNFWGDNGKSEYSVDIDIILEAFGSQAKELGGEAKNLLEALDEAATERMARSVHGLLDNKVIGHIWNPTDTAVGFLPTRGMNIFYKTGRTVYSNGDTSSWEQIAVNPFKNENNKSTLLLSYCFCWQLL